jgi:hypothetical protein
LPLRATDACTRHAQAERIVFALTLFVSKSGSSTRDDGIGPPSLTAILRALNVTCVSARAPRPSERIKPRRRVAAWRTARQAGAARAIRAQTPGKQCAGAATRDAAPPRRTAATFAQLLPCVS